MRWRATSNVNIYGTTYSIDAKVNTDSWTPEQVHYQVYLGNIYPDFHMGNIYTFQGTNAKWNGVYTNRAWSQAARGVFVAPTTGRILVTSYQWARTYSSSGSVTVKVQLNTGGTILQGDHVRTMNSNLFRDTRLISQSASAHIGGLVPGATYNIYQMESNSGGGAEIRYPRIQIVPVAK